MEEAEGFELELAYRPRDNWDILLNLGYVDSQTTNGLAEVTRQLDVRPGTPIPSVPDLTVSIWTRYNFQDGPLNGFYIGGGITHTGDRRMSPRGDRPIVVPSYFSWDTREIFEISTP